MQSMAYFSIAPSTMNEYVLKMAIKEKVGNMNIKFPSTKKTCICNFHINKWHFFERFLSPFIIGTVKYSSNHLALRFQISFGFNSWCTRILFLCVYVQYMHPQRDLLHTWWLWYVVFIWSHILRNIDHEWLWLHFCKTSCPTFPILQVVSLKFNPVLGGYPISLITSCSWVVFYAFPLIHTNSLIIKWTWKELQVELLFLNVCAHDNFIFKLGFVNILTFFRFCYNVPFPH
jgi:hypothetical protein